MKWPNELIESLKGSSCAVFVGAGLSQGAGLPSWKKMLTELITEAKGIPGVTPQRLAEYKAMMQDRSKYLPLASLLGDVPSIVKIG